MKLQGSITKEDGFAVIRIPMDEVGALIAELVECSCSGPKSNSTILTRARLATDLMYAEGGGEVATIRVPLDEVHALRVSLSPCPCKEPKSISTQTIRDRLAQGLARINAVRTSR